MSFKAAFTKKSPKLINVGSEAWKKYISSQAPEGMHYRFNGESIYYLIPDDNSTLDMKVKVIVPDDLKKIGYKNANELSELLYRAQRSVEIEKPEFSHKNEPIEFEKLVRSFSSNIESESGKFYIFPEPFKEPHRIPIKINDIEYYFEIKQVPFPSLKELRFESSEDGMIFIKIAYDEETNKMKFSLSYNLKKADSMFEIYQNKKLLLDLAEGNVKIFGKYTKVLTEDQSSALKHLVFFYSKLYDIEQVLNIQFNPSKLITSEDVLNTYKTHISFVKNDYYFNLFKHDSFEITMKEDIDFSSTKNIAMLGYNDVTVTILDQTIQLVEQFVFKSTEPSADNKKLNKKGNSIKFNVKDDKIRYNKLFKEVPPTPDMNEISIKLNHATNIEDVENIE